MKSDFFNIVVPVYNASQHIDKLLDELEQLFHEKKFKLILVDDGSTDATHSRLLEILDNYSFITELVRLGKNTGQHSATLIGLQYVQGEFAVTIDDDLQHRPSEIKKLVEAYYQTGADLIYGIYENKKHSFYRNMGSWLLKRIVRFSNPKLVNITSFRLIKSEIIQPFKHSQQPIVFIDEYLINASLSTQFVTVQHNKRIDGKSTYSNQRLIRFALNIILFHSTIPLQFITKLGILMSVTFLGIGGYFIWQKIFEGAQIGFTSIIVAIFFSSGLILFALGIIGEYIRKIWIAQNSLCTIFIRSHNVFRREKLPSQED